MRTMFGLLALILLAGCWDEKRMEVNAISNPNILRVESYTIISNNAAVGEDDLNFQRVAALVENAVEGYGLYRAERADEADVVVKVAYGVGEREVKTEFVKVRRHKGEKWVPVQMVKYPKYLRITALVYPSDEAGMPVQLWSVYVTQSDTSDDIYKVMPQMVAAATGSIGTDTEGNRRLKVKHNSPLVKYVTGEYIH